MPISGLALQPRLVGVAVNYGDRPQEWPRSPTAAKASFVRESAFIFLTGPTSLFLTKIRRIDFTNFDKNRACGPGEKDKCRFPGPAFQPRVVGVAVNYGDWPQEWPRSPTAAKASCVGQSAFIFLTGPANLFSTKI